MEDGSFVTSDAIREAADRLEVALKVVSEGSFKSDREKDKLTYALGTSKHTGRVRNRGETNWSSNWFHRKPIGGLFDGRVESRYRRQQSCSPNVGSIHPKN